MNPEHLKQHSVHASHCCKHWCKYGSDRCPVGLGMIEQRYTCHDLGCDIHAEESELTALQQRVAELEKDNAALRGDLDIAERQASKRAHANAALREQVAGLAKGLRGLLEVSHAEVEHDTMDEVNRCVHCYAREDDTHQPTCKYLLAEQAALKALADTAAAGEGK